MLYELLEVMAEPRSELVLDFTDLIDHWARRERAGTGPIRHRPTPPQDPQAPHPEWKAGAARETTL